MTDTAVEQEPKAAEEKQTSDEPVEKDLDALLSEFDEKAPIPEKEDRRKRHLP